MLCLSMLKEERFEKSSPTLSAKGISKVGGKVRKPQATPQLTKFSASPQLMLDPYPEP